MGVVVVVPLVPHFWFVFFGLNVLLMLFYSVANNFSLLPESSRLSLLTQTFRVVLALENYAWQGLRNGPANWSYCLSVIWIVQLKMFVKMTISISGLVLLPRTSSWVREHVLT